MVGELTKSVGTGIEATILIEFCVVVDAFVKMEEEVFVKE